MAAVNSAKRHPNGKGGKGGSLRGPGGTNMNVVDRPMIKFILLGCCGVGKTAILNRFCDGRFSSTAQATIGVDFKYRDMDLDGGEGGCFRLHVWDTAGQEQFHVVSKPYYRQADGVILVYDCTSMETLSALEKYVNDARELCPLGTTMALLGNKCDLVREGGLGRPGAVGRSEAEQFARRRGIPIFFETSAANGECIDEAFEVLCKHAVNNKRTNGELRDVGAVHGIQGTESGRTAAGRSLAPRGNVRFVQRNANAEAEAHERKCAC